MSEFFGIVAAGRNGILLLLLAFVVLGVLLNWLLWMFRWGRFRGTSPQTDRRLRDILVDFFTKLIDDFRHLLALVVVLLFALALFLAMLPGLNSGNLGDLKDGIQAVAAALGGLIGSIIGYYFGESAGSRTRQTSRSDEPQTSTSPVEQPDSPGGVQPLPNKPKIQAK